MDMSSPILTTTLDPDLPLDSNVTTEESEVLFDTPDTPDISGGGYTSKHSNLPDTHDKMVSFDYSKKGSGTYIKIDSDGKQTDERMIIDNPYMKIIGSDGQEITHSHNVSVPYFIAVLPDGYYLFRYNNSGVNEKIPIISGETTSYPTMSKSYTDQEEYWEVFKQKELSKNKKK